MRIASLDCRLHNHAFANLLLVGQGGVAIGVFQDDRLGIRATVEHRHGLDIQLLACSREVIPFQIAFAATVANSDVERTEVQHFVGVGQVLNAGATVGLAEHFTEDEDRRILTISSFAKHFEHGFEQTVFLGRLGVEVRFVSVIQDETLRAHTLRGNDHATAEVFLVGKAGRHDTDLNQGAMHLLGDDDFLAIVEQGRRFLQVVEVVFGGCVVIHADDIALHVRRQRRLILDDPQALACVTTDGDDARALIAIDRSGDDQHFGFRVAINLQHQALRQHATQLDCLDAIAHRTSQAALLLGFVVEAQVLQQPLGNDSLLRDIDGVFAILELALTDDGLIIADLGDLDCVGVRMRLDLNLDDFTAEFAHFCSFAFK